jgi:hypothetical protein
MTGWDMRKKLLAVALVATACDVPSSLQPLDDAGFERRDAGQSTDAGQVLDAGHIVDAGQIVDAGHIVEADAGQAVDAGQVVVETDAGQPVDAGPTPVECELLDPPAYEYECRGDEDFCDTSYDERTEAVDIIATWSHRDGDNIFIDILTRRPVWFVDRAGAGVCLSTEPTVAITDGTTSSVETAQLGIPQRPDSYLDCNLGVGGFGGGTNSPVWIPWPSSTDEDCNLQHPDYGVFMSSLCDVSVESNGLPFMRLLAQQSQATYYLTSGSTAYVGSRWSDITADTTGTDVRFVEVVASSDPFPDLDFVSICDITCAELGGAPVITGGGRPSPACRNTLSER